MGGVLKLLIFSYSQNPTGYEHEQDYWSGGGRKSKQLESAAPFEARIASGLTKRAIKIKSCGHLGLNEGVSTTGCAR